MFRPIPSPLYAPCPRHISVFLSFSIINPRPSSVSHTFIAAVSLSLSLCSNLFGCPSRYTALPSPVIETTVLVHVSPCDQPQPTHTLHSFVQSSSLRSSLLPSPFLPNPILRPFQSQLEPAAISYKRVTNRRSKQNKTKQSKTKQNHLIASS